MTAFNMRSVLLFVRRNQIIIDLVLIHKVKKVKASRFSVFQAVFASYISKDLLEINLLFFPFDRTLEAVITLPL